MTLRSTYRNTVIAVGGPPHSGKSVFLSELYRQLLERQPSRIFRQAACPDGEGMWSSEADPEIVRSLRRKGMFSDEFMATTLDGIEALGRNPHYSIVLLDLGGKRTAQNAEILQRSHYLILVSSSVEEIPRWQAFAKAEGCETLAVLESRLGNKPAQSQLDISQIPVSGVLWNLDRELDRTAYEGAIAQLAEWLLDRFEQKTV